MNTIKGAIIGDIVGSIFEGTIWTGDKIDEVFVEGFSYKMPKARAKEEDIIGQRALDFSLFTKDSTYTDDTVLTCAIMQALCSTDKFIKLPVITKMALKLFYSNYKEVGYGGKFKHWAQDMDTHINGESFGNGAAMRISPIVQKAIYENYTVQDLLKMVEYTSKTTHKNAYSILGAKIIALTAFIAQKFPCQDKTKIIQDSYFHLTKKQFIFPSLFELRIENQKFTSSAQETVKMALAAFNEGSSFEDTIRKAISVGGDTDTIAAMSGTIAGAYYGVSDDIWNTAENYLDLELLNVYNMFELEYGD